VTSGSPAPSPRRGPSPLLLLLGLAAIALVVAWLGRVTEGRRLVANMDAALARGDRVEAIVLARAAIEARCPGCEAPEIGYARLEAIAKDAEGRADDASAVAAWRAVRAGSLATTVFDDSGERRERADAEIARLEHRIDLAAAAAGGTGAASPAATEPRLRQALAARSIPSGSVFLFVAVGGILFLVGALRFAGARRFAPTDLGLSLLGSGLAVAGILLF
jgi:hypothetical protein